MSAPYRGGGQPDFDEECMDDPTRRLLIKKTWCHGQAIAPLQGLALGAWGIFADDLAIGWRVFLVCMAFVLPAWSITTWWAMKGRSMMHWRIICGFGLVLEVLYVGVIILAVQDLDELLNIAALIFTGLQMCETISYLAATTFLRSAFVDDTGHQEPLLSWKMA